MKALFLFLTLLFAGTLAASADIPSHKYSHRQSARARRRVQAHHDQTYRKIQRWLRKRQRTGNCPNNHG